MSRLAGFGSRAYFSSAGVNAMADDDDTGKKAKCPMIDTAQAGMSCCDGKMTQLSTAGDARNQVKVYRCATCSRVDSRGWANGPGWVSARAFLFLKMRNEALRAAGFEPIPLEHAFCFMDLETFEVGFSPLPPLSPLVLS
jgi:hypothetical protein